MPPLPKPQVKQPHPTPFLMLLGQIQALLERVLRVPIGVPSMPPSVGPAAAFLARDRAVEHVERHATHRRHEVAVGPQRRQLALVGGTRRATPARNGLASASPAGACRTEGTSQERLHLLRPGFAFAHLVPPACGLRRQRCVLPLVSRRSQDRAPLRGAEHEVVPAVIGDLVLTASVRQTTRRP